MTADLGEVVERTPTEPARSETGASRPTRPADETSASTKPRSFFTVPFVDETTWSPLAARHVNSLGEAGVCRDSDLGWVAMKTPISEQAMGTSGRACPRPEKARSTMGLCLPPLGEDLSLTTAQAWMRGPYERVSGSRSPAVAFGGSGALVTSCQVMLYRPSSCTLTARPAVPPFATLPYRPEMEQGFGVPLGDVRVLRGDASLRERGALASTEDGLIRFAQMRPDRLTVAHEVAHILQYRNSKVRPAGLHSDPSDRAEQEADRAGRAVVAGAKATVRNRPSARVMYRRRTHEVRASAVSYQFDRVYITIPAEPDVDTPQKREARLYSAYVEHLLGEEIRPSERRKVLGIARGAVDPYLFEDSPKGDQWYIQAPIALALLDWVAVRQGVALERLPGHARITSSQLEILQLGMHLDSLFEYLQDPAFGTPLPAWYSRELFDFMVRYEGESLQRFAALDLTQPADQRAHQQIREGFIRPALVAEAIRTDSQVAPGVLEYLGLAKDHEEVDVVHLSVLLRFVKTQPAVADAVLSGQWVWRGATTPAHEMVTRFHRFVKRVGLVDADLGQDVNLVNQYQDRNAAPLPSTFEAAPRLQAPFFDTALGKSHRFTMNVHFQDVFEELSNRLGGFSYRFELIRVPDDDWENAEGVEATTGLGEGVEASDLVNLGGRAARAWEYAQEDFATLDEQLEMARAIRYTSLILGHPDPATTLLGANAALRSIGSLLDWTLNVVLRSRWSMDYSFPERGLYVVRAICDPILQSDDEFRRAPSVAWIPVFARDQEEMGRLRLQALRERDDKNAQALADLYIQLEDETDAGRRDEIKGEIGILRAQVTGHAANVLSVEREQRKRQRAALQREGVAGDPARQETLDQLTTLDGELERRIDLRNVRASRYPTGTIERLQAVMVTDSGQVVYPLVEVVRVDNGGTRQRFHAWDVTTPTGPEAKGASANGRIQAIQDVLKKLYAQWSAFGRGDLTVFVPHRPQANEGKAVHIRVTPDLAALGQETVDNVVLVASTAALVAAPLTGGATLALLVPIGIVGSIPSAYRLLDRGAAGTFGLDFAAAMDIVDVVGSLAGLGQAAAGMRAVRTAKFLAFVGAGSDAFGVTAVAYSVLDAGRSRGADDDEGARRARVAKAFAQGLQLYGQMRLASAVSARVDADAQLQRLDLEHQRLKSGVRDAELLTDADGAPVRWRPDVEGLEGLPADLRGRVRMVVDDSLDQGTVKVSYAVDRLGLVTDIVVRRGPETPFSTVDAHFQTARSMARFQGVAGSVRLVVIRLKQLLGFRNAFPPGTRGWEAWLEVKKLPGVIEGHLNRIETGTLRDAGIDSELASLRSQLAEHEAFLRAAEADPALLRRPGRGYVAAESVHQARRRNYETAWDSFRAEYPHRPRPRQRVTQEDLDTLGLPPARPGYKWKVTGVRGGDLRLAYVSMKTTGTPSEGSYLNAEAMSHGLPPPPEGHTYEAGDNPTSPFDFQLRLTSAGADEAQTVHWDEAAGSWVFRIRTRPDSGEAEALAQFGEAAVRAVRTDKTVAWRLRAGRLELMATEKGGLRKAWDTDKEELVEVSEDFVFSDTEELPALEWEGTSQQVASHAHFRARAKAKASKQAAETDLEAAAAILGIANAKALRKMTDAEVRQKHGEASKQVQDSVDVEAVLEARRRYTEQHKAQTVAAESLGDAGARAYVEQHYPGAKEIKFPRTATGQDEFDLVFVVDTGDKLRILVVEAKGAGGELGLRLIGEQNHRQGTIGYLVDVAESTRKRLMVMPDKEAMAVFDRLARYDARAEQDFEVEYIVVETRVGQKQGAPVMKSPTARKFPLSPESQHYPGG